MVGRLPLASLLRLSSNGTYLRQRIASALANLDSQSILCFADSTLESMTLEPGPVDNGKVVKVIDGGSDTRYCRNSDPLYVLERKYGPNSQYGYPANHGSD